VGLDRQENERRTFVLDKIERMRVVDAPAAVGKSDGR
jgi:predicted DNA-binding transcriptional regulator YafY